MALGFIVMRSLNLMHNGQLQDELMDMLEAGEHPGKEAERWLYLIGQFTSAPWSRDDDVPKTESAFSVSCRFQVVIWFGWTSYCCANPPRVFSPAMASKATFALKAAEWFRLLPFALFCSLFCPYQGVTGSRFST